MKNYLFILPGILAVASISAQKTVRHPDGSYWRQCTKFEISRPLRDIAREHPAPVFKGTNYILAPDEKANRDRSWQHFTPNNNTDPVLQNYMGEKAPQSTLQNFDGEQSSQGFVPLDPNGMVGPNAFVQIVNSNYQIFDKNGNALIPATDLANIWTGSGDNGDPVVMYDKFADRWIIEEFNQNCYCEMMFAVSQTPDPTGSYYLYYFTPDASDFADYPKFVIWADGFYETCNCQNDKVVVYDRTKMEAGDMSAGFIVMPFNYSPNAAKQGFFCPMILDADGQLPAYGSPEYLFYYTDDNWGAGFKDQIMIDQISVNWVSQTGTITQFDSLATAPFNSYFTGGTEKDIDQPGKPKNLDALDGFFQYRIPYTRWTGYNDAVMVYPVNVRINTSAINAGLRWYELRQDTVTTKWSIYQQGTYSPDTIVNRWLPSIAMNADGSIGLAYSVSNSSSVYPGIRYTGRNACDPLGVMTLAEGTAISGGAVGATSHRWGDYCNTSIDSDGVTFWNTNAYIDGSANYNTRIFSFQVPACISTGVTQIKAPSPSLTAYQNGEQLDIKATDVPLGEKTLLDLYTAEGKRVFVSNFTPSNSTLETQINVSNFAKGIYLLRIGNESYQRVIKVSLN